MTVFRLLFLTSLAFAVFACGGTSGAHTPPSRPPSVGQDASEPASLRPQPVQGVSAEATAALVSASNAFGVDLWQELRNRPGNMTVSPASISLALAMTWAGARSETAEQMAQVLHFGDAQAVHAAAANLLAAWNDPERETYELRVVNRLFGEQTFNFQQDFLALTRARYGAPLETLSFTTAPDPSRQHINDWVAQQTNDRIRDLLPSGSVSPLTRLVLTNAIYFLGKWLTPFEPNATHNSPYFVGGNSPIQAPTMNLTARFHYMETSGLKVLQMPYRGEDLAMTILLPTARDGLAALEAGLGLELLVQWLGSLAEEEVAVALPKFTIDPAQPIQLRETLSAMGMPLAFTDAADFTGMADPLNSREQLRISEVFHKAFVKVDEEGTEAAAATAVVMVGRSAAMGPQPKLFVADHPFLFLIRDVRTQMILFVGRVDDPR